MANIKSARKRARQNIVRNELKSSQRATLRTAIKKVRKAIDGGDKAAATEACQASGSVIDGYAGKGILHRNTAARYKSRLVAAVKGMA